MKAPTLIIGLMILVLALIAGCSSENAIKEQVEAANYCETESDCELVSSKCPFGCYVYVNVNEADRITELIDNFDSKCAYGCVRSYGVACNDGKCEAILGNPENQMLPNGYTLKNYSVEEVMNDSCNEDFDCETPMEYLIQSRCPFTSLCLDNRCAVVCPDFE